MSRNTILVTSRAQTVVDAGDPDTLLLNLDPTVTIYLGDDRGITSVLSAITPLQPLASAVVNGNDGATWAVTPSGQQAFIAISPNTSLLTVSPAVIAQQIFNSGINSPVPTLVRAQQSIGSSNTWGPFLIPLTTGGSYIITANTSFTNSQVVDIFVEHLDSLGTVVYAENYTIGLGGVGNFSPVILRGNLQGTTLRISGQTCGLPYINALGLINGPFTIGPFVWSVYTTPLSVAETRPKMVPSNTQGGFLQGFAGVVLAAGASQGPVPIPSYAGRAIIDVFSPGTLARATLQGFTVAGAATPQYTQRIIQFNAATSVVNEIIIPQKFCTLVELNGDSVGRTPGVNIMAADYL